MKIETRETEWEPITIIIETPLEASHFLEILKNDPSNITDDLYWVLHKRLQPQ